MQWTSDIIDSHWKVWYGKLRIRISDGHCGCFRSGRAAVRGLYPAAQMTVNRGAREAIRTAAFIPNTDWSRPVDWTCGSSLKKWSEPFHFNHYIGNKSLVKRYIPCSHREGAASSKSESFFVHANVAERVFGWAARVISYKNAQNGTINTTKAVSSEWDIRLCAIYTKWLSEYWGINAGAKEKLTGAIQYKGKRSARVWMKKKSCRLFVDYGSNYGDALEPARDCWGELRVIQQTPNQVTRAVHVWASRVGSKTAWAEPLAVGVFTSYKLTMDVELLLLLWTPSRRRLSITELWPLHSFSSGHMANFAITKVL